MNRAVPNLSMSSSTRAWDKRQIGRYCSIGGSHYKTGPFHLAWAREWWGYTTRSLTGLHHSFFYNPSFYHLFTFLFNGLLSSLWDTIGPQLYLLSRHCEDGMLDEGGVTWLGGEYWSMPLEQLVEVLFLARGELLSHGDCFRLLCLGFLEKRESRASWATHFLRRSMWYILVSCCLPVRRTWYFTSPTRSITSYGPCHRARNLHSPVGTRTSTLSPTWNSRGCVPLL